VDGALIVLKNDRLRACTGTDDQLLTSIRKRIGVQYYGILKVTVSH